MRIRLFALILMLTFAVSITGVPTRNAEAHQPFCEFTDLTIETAWRIEDPSVSVAFYANLYPAGDVDYYTFEAEQGDPIYLQMTIPVIEGQDDRWVPMMAVSGPGIAAGETVPAAVELPDSVMIIPMVDTPEQFYEPFGRDYYWIWQEITFEAPQTGQYMTAVWHPDEAIGRYAFVVGKKERLGGDLDCLASFGDYWTPLVAGENPYRDDGAMSGDHDDDHDADHTHEEGALAYHSHHETIEMGDSGVVPGVDLQVIPLGNGDHNLRIQTMNFTFAPQNVDQAHVRGQGHAHLYIDGVKITRLYGEWYYLEHLPAGAQTITVTLYANDHRALAVGGEPVSATVHLADISDVGMHHTGELRDHAHD